MARREVGRRTRRRSSRATPRRWLPFLALIALVAGIVAVERRSDDAAGPDSRVDAAAARLPVAAEVDALSTAWYCSGGTSGIAAGAAAPVEDEDDGDDGDGDEDGDDDDNGDDGDEDAAGDVEADLSVVIANAAAEDAVAEVAAVGPEAAADTTVEVPARSRTRVQASDLLDDGWVGLTVEVLGGDVTVEREVVGEDGFSLSPCASQASTRWYVPSGSTELGAEEHLVLFNPFPDGASVEITFSTDDGPRAPGALRAVSVPGRSVRVVPLDDLPSRRPLVATRIEARAGRIVVDRLQSYDGSGEATVGADGIEQEVPLGLTSTPAIPEAAPRWFFPDAVLASGYRQELVIHNPSDEAAEIDVVLTYEEPERQPELEPVQLRLRADEVVTVDLAGAEGLDGGLGLTVDVRSLEGIPVLAELIVFGRPLLPPSPVTDLDAEGDGGDGGEIPPEEREDDPDGDGDDGDDSGEGTAGPSDPFPGFTVVAGSPVAATEWLLASFGPLDGREASVVVANPGTEPVEVSVEEFAAGDRGATDPPTLTVPPGDRRVVDLDAAERRSALRLTADGPIVVGSAIFGDDGTGLSQALATPRPGTVDVLPTSPTR